jgi:hypothetical protein
MSLIRGAADAGGAAIGAAIAAIEATANSAWRAAREVNPM